MPAPVIIERLWRRAIAAPWYSPLGWLRIALLWPMALIYRLVSGAVRAFGAEAETLKFPIISVGNITVGGTGKTPFVEWMADEFMKRGKRTGVVCSGYGRTSRAPILERGSLLRERGAEEIGDEVAQLAGSLPECVFAVDKSKQKAVKSLISSGKVDLIIVDDGFQTRPLWRAVDLVLINTQAPRSDYRPFPAGTMRQPFRALRSADRVVFTKLASLSAAAPLWLSAEVSKHTDSAERLTSTSEFELAPVIGALSDALKGSQAFAFSGIADPKSFQHSLVNSGVSVAAAIEFPDHFLYDKDSVAEIRSKAAESGAAWIVTTEKDWVKLKRFDWGDSVVAVHRQRVVMAAPDKFIDDVLHRITETGT